ncbi:MAG: hypothetical protein NTZ67_06615 [Gammaproteobacteria bacterium]|nr:hypothetical protein [Gammaproteobacteria bacterium]
MFRSLINGVREVRDVADFLLNGVTGIALALEGDQPTANQYRNALRRAQEQDAERRRADDLRKTQAQLLEKTLRAELAEASARKALAEALLRAHQSHLQTIRTKLNEQALHERIQPLLATEWQKRSALANKEEAKRNAIQSKEEGWDVSDKDSSDDDDFVQVTRTALTR